MHFSDTTTRDITQSNSGNRFRLGEDRMIGPYLDRSGFFSLENGGGAHFHVAMLANMTYPFTEAQMWNEFAPRTLKQILIRSTNVLGYKPQPKNVMQRTGEMICEHYDVIRCFDFLNHIENMRPFAEIVLNSKRNIFQPAISLSYARDFDVARYMTVTAEIVRMMADVAGVSEKKAEKLFILGLKDMAGVCPPRFMRQLVGEIRKTYPDLVVHYHRHYTDGLFVPAVGAAAQAGAHILDTAIGASVRWYGQGEVLSTAAYIEEELGLKTHLNKDMIRDCNFVLKQIMPYYDRYCSPYFQGIDYDVIEHGMPGGATSSSQEGAMKQGYIRLLPHMLRFLAGTRKIIRYHDVTPGSQITWNTAFLAVVEAYKRGGERYVRQMLGVLETVATVPENELSEDVLNDRLKLYRDANDAFRDLLLGKYGKLPLGFPPDWVYQSAFGADAEWALNNRTDASPLEFLEEMDISAEQESLKELIKRQPTDEELVLYLNHPGMPSKPLNSRSSSATPTTSPWTPGSKGLNCVKTLNSMTPAANPIKWSFWIFPNPENGVSVVRYLLDSQILTYQVKVQEPETDDGADHVMADLDNPYHLASPSRGDLWVMYVSAGDYVKEGDEMFNVSIMKQEKAVFAPFDAMVKRVLKTANYSEDRKMVPVREGELLVELAPAPSLCKKCQEPIASGDYKFCPFCGETV
ncbi:MAG: hypothetical protein R2861_12755 [Desulfobacterales bacterium]